MSFRTYIPESYDRNEGIEMCRRRISTTTNYKSMLMILLENYFSKRYYNNG